MAIGKIGIPLHKRSLCYYEASVLNTGPNRLSRNNAEKLPQLVA